MDTENFPESISKFIEFVQEEASKNKVKITISNNSFLEIGNSTCNGYFSDEPAELAVATGKSIHNWLPVFIHEYSHMTQWAEKHSSWTDTYFGEECATDLLFQWIERKIELNQKDLSKIVHTVMRVELNCEKRTVNNIIIHKLPINVEEYIQKSLSYVWFHHIVKDMRKWYIPGKEPYNNPEIWTQMPKSFKGLSFYNLPDKYRKILEKCFD